MMLVSPLLPSPVFSPTRASDDSLHYRPAKDLEAFNSLLPPPVEFVEGSSSGTLAVAEGKYEPINASPKVSKPEPDKSPKPPVPTPIKALSNPTPSTGAKLSSLHPGAIDTAWPQTGGKGTGLYNSGNTCFLNSALQCLFHTPPLLALLFAHKPDDCRARSSFCMICNLRSVAGRAHTGNGPFSPNLISNHLQTIAKHMRKGRQEDTHEFLRYAIDALQKACLSAYPPKLDSKLAETTWVHKIFGGRLRSRVTCQSCGHNSDTFDRILDLSLDIFKCDSLRDALQKFIAIDYLKGADKYKCEKCKKHVNAEKRFTIHEAPLVLTVHLKRFSPLGRKIGHLVQYDERLALRPFMSDGEFGPLYSLYGVICHAGGGPNSGHYYAFVKSKDGHWREMNDDITQSTSMPTGRKNAYMLFYIQNKGQGLEAAVNGVTKPPLIQRNGLAAGMKKRLQKLVEEEDKGVKVDKPFIGPLLPSPTLDSDVAKRKVLNSVDPQAASLKSKIEAAAKAKASAALDSLGSYASESEDDRVESSPKHEPSEDDDSKDDRTDADGKGKQKDNGDSFRGVDKSLSSPPRASSPQPVPASSFYSGVKGKKRKTPDSASDYENTPKKPFSTPNQARTSGYGRDSLNPYNTSALSRYGKRSRRMGI